jgi:2-oxoisovalerate dehydrogenase E1 component beta subunit
MHEVTYLEAIREALQEEMRRDPMVMVLGEDVGIYGGAFQVTKGLYEEFDGERVMDTPICETLIVGVAIGLALQCYRPVAEMQFADFISCGFDQIVNQAATLHYRYGGKACVPMVVRGPAGAGGRGGLYHSQNPEAWFAHRPGLKVVCPATAYDAKGLLKAAIRDDNPVIYLEHKYLYRRIKEQIPDEDFIVPLGKALVRREGRDVTVITYSAPVHKALAAAQELEKEGISVEVLDLRTVSPLDTEAILQSVQKTSKVLIVHEATRSFGVGAEVAALIAEEAFSDLDAPIMRLCTPDTHYPFSPPLEDFILPSEEKIINAVKELAVY